MYWGRITGNVHLHNLKKQDKVEGCLRFMSDSPVGRQVVSVRSDRNWCRRLLGAQGTPTIVIYTQLTRAPRGLLISGGLL